MSDSIITVENLGKKYSLRHQTGERYTALRDILTEKATRIFRRKRNEAADPTREDFWALKDVNFEVKQGEVLGIIGRNGAGKSTLLKILSRITDPTEGRVRIKGRVASLLEVGTGFHPELTGRENIFLNGAILGMGRVEIKTKFDEIVAFAETEKFLDTPVKRYSSGMYVRLAFAVAAHLEPDILVIDEVLAVGDAEFQKKCLGKMRDVATGGRTVLFVTHNMGTIEALCNSAFLLSRGKLISMGSPRETILRYTSLASSIGNRGVDGWVEHTVRTNPCSPGNLMIRRSRLLGRDHNPVGDVPMGEKIVIEFEVVGMNRHPDSQAGVMVKSMYGSMVANVNTGMIRPTVRQERSDVEIIMLEIPRFPFVPGRYAVDLSIARKGIGRLDFVQDALTIDVIDSNLYGTGYQPGAQDGLVFLDCNFTVAESEQKIAAARG